MASRASYFKIGLFTLSALALLVAAIIALGAGALLQDRVIVETYLDETVQGIEIGSAVKYRGVQVGNVDAITFTSSVYEQRKPFEERRGYVLVRMAVSHDALGQGRPEGFRQLLGQMVEQGLRVRLRPQGLTGLSYMEMDYVQQRDRGDELAFDWTPAHPYVPSSRSIGSSLEDALFSIGRTLQRLEEADLGKIATDMDELVVSVTALVNNEQVAALRDEASRLMVETRETSRAVREFLESPEMEVLLDDASGAAAALRRAVETSQEDVRATVGDLRQTAEQLRAASRTFPETMEQLNRTLRRLSALLMDQQRQLAAALENVESASAHLLELTEEARRYPARVLFGDPPPPVEIPDAE
jgi:phospholipid/cholesterol/gamma-HCH transport system substrate-binding protein/paraquat-inducible protein B